MTKQEITNRVKKSVETVDPKASVILFGSRARGDFKSNSDWDFLILTSKESDETLMHCRPQQGHEPIRQLAKSSPKAIKHSLSRNSEKGSTSS